MPELESRDVTDEVTEGQVGAPPENPVGGFIHQLAYNATGSPIFWLFFIGILSSYPWIRALISTPLETPKVYGIIPEFSFTDEQGKPFGTQELKGKVWIASFIFTNCSSICPDLMRKMMYIRDKIKSIKWMIHLVSFTVDPLRDTPEVLDRYAQEHLKGFYDKKTWKFLTGPLETIEKVIIDGFKIAIARPEQDPSLFEIAHGGKIVLVDQKGQIRGYYSTDDEGLKKLLLDLALVTNNY